MSIDTSVGGNYAILPAHIRYNKNLSDSEKILFCEITALSNKKGYCYASNKYLSTVYGVSINTISRRINKLKNKGFIKVHLIKETDGNNIKERRIYPSLDAPIPIPKFDDRGTPNSGEIPIPKNGEVNTLSINNLNNNNNNIRDHNALFESWYDLYNKKKARPKALKAFIKAMEKHEYEIIEKGTIAYLKSVDNKQFQAYPATFLNQEQYMDDHDYKQNNVYENKGDPIDQASDDFDYLNRL